MITQEQLLTIQQHHEQKVRPLLKKHDAEEIERTWETEFQWYNALTIKFRGYEIKVSAQEFQKVVALKWLLENFSLIESVLERITCKDPFYSQILGYLESVTTKYARKNNLTTLAFHFICDELKNQGKKIWS